MPSRSKRGLWSKFWDAGHVLPGKSCPVVQEMGRGAHPTQKKKVRLTSVNRTFRKAAATYSPTWWGSTIGAGGFNFSVRDGKRWFPTALTAAVCYLREINAPFWRCPGNSVWLLKRSRAISTGRLNTLLCVHLLPINVVVSHDP